MKIAWAADIHLDQADGLARGRFFCRLQDVVPNAVLLAGDIADAKSLESWLQTTQRLVPAPLRYVLGNHDFYRSSIAKVREAQQRDSRWLHPAMLPERLGPIELVGVDGWGWGPRFGELRMSDFHMIKEFSRGPREPMAKRLAEESADLLQVKLAACTGDRIVVLTHVPPFHRACLYQGKPSDAIGLSHFCCPPVGDALLTHAVKNPDRQITVLCGHTHGPCEVRITPNLEVRVAGSDYGSPRVEVLDL